MQRNFVILNGMTNPVDDAISKIDEALETLEVLEQEATSTVATSSLPDDSKNPDVTKLYDVRKTPPALHDQSAASGTTPELESDDDVDTMGRDAGIHYSENEELHIDQKIPLTTPVDPPKPDKPSA